MWRAFFMDKQPYKKRPFILNASLGLALPAALTIVLFFAALFWEILPTLEKNHMDRKREMIAELTKGALHTLEYYYKQCQKGELTQKQAREKAVSQLRTMRYGADNKDYFWVNDFKPRIIMHPYRPELEGGDVSEFEDPEGKRLFSEVVKLVEDKGEGYVDYLWQWKDDPKRVVPKLSFVKGFEPWQWIVGTGIYVEDVSASMAGITRRLSYLSLAVLGLVALLELYIVYQSLRAEKSRKKAVIQSRSSRWMLRLVIDNIPQLIFWKDKKGSFMGCNKAFAEHVGLSDPETVKGKTDHELAWGQEEGGWARVREHRVMNSGVPELHVIESHAKALGTPLWMDSNRIPLKDQNDRIVGILCTLEDITRRKEMTRALKESERNFRTLVENVPVGITIVQQGDIVYANPEQERILGPVKPPLSLKRLRKRASADMLKLLDLAGSPTATADQVLDLDLSGLAYKKGAIFQKARWVHCRTRNITYQGKNSLLVIMLDITKAKELEQMVRIQDKMASLGRVAAGIAHEIRNPLSGINMYLTALEGMLANCPNKEAFSIIDKMQAASGKTEGVIKRVLDFSKPSAPKLEWVNLNGLVENSLDLSQVSLRKSGIKLITDLNQGLPLVNVDPGLFEQVFMNLITNAMQALETKTGSKMVRISSGFTERAVWVKVADSGPGVSRELKDRIFDPFFTGRKDGSGIGLSLCHRIVSDHGGRILVDTSNLGGALFVVEMPVNLIWGHPE
jgi:PAS domain S-box-containing protein